MEITKFKAKKYDNTNEYVYGSYFYDGRRHYIITKIIDVEHAMYGHYSNNVELFVVNPETLEKYTEII